MLGSFDWREAPDEEQVASRAIFAARQHFFSFEDLREPLPDSMLASEDDVTPYEPMTAVVHSHRGRALDNLAALFQVICGPDGTDLFLYPYALYPLIRAAVEAAARALWVISPETKHSRVFRSLQMTHDAVVNRKEFATLLSPEAKRELEAWEARTIDRLIEIQGMVGRNKNRRLKALPNTTTILTHVSKVHPDPVAPETYLLSPLGVWKASSAFLHGSNFVVHDLSERQQLTEFKDGVAEVKVTPSASIIAGFLQTAVNLIYALDERYQYLATRNYAGDPLIVPQGESTRTSR